MNFSKLDRTFIIAEIGVNHEGNADVAADLIRKAAASGADAVKFQTFTPEHYISSEQPERRERVRSMQLGQADFRRLAAIAREHSIRFFSTPLGLQEADFLDEIASMFKIASGDLTYLDLISHVVRKGKPVILSTGLGTEAEIERAVRTALEVRPSAREDGSLMLMHCVSAYPTPPEEAHLRNIGWLIERFGLPVGYSDHTLGIKACELAVAAGAVALEKHFTYRRANQTFHDHALSAEPAELAALVEAVRIAERFLGRKERARGESEAKILDYARRSVGARVDIRAGTPLEDSWLIGLRPLWGVPIEAKSSLIGRKLKRAVTAGELIRDEDLEA